MTTAIIIGAAIAWCGLSFWAATALGRWLDWCDRNMQ